MPRRGGRGFWGRGFGVGCGNPYPFCRFYPWLPRRWWAAGPAAYVWPVTPPYWPAYARGAWPARWW
jgi:hypothetical protein